ncbi:zinc-dependent alcohol dehydrogenase family protein [Pararhizobium gei]|uniref:zinc-dependent alcohol dehydrogenase family protein n=1 Tax=Pararhizobium gei TaxID=1395951 RepID=UPI0023D9D774|nr:zinc-dependent alcohol dehydrogenase family protein [Rhizobium gei]
MQEGLAAWVTEYGRPEDVIRLADLPRTAPGPGMIEIAVEQAAINPSDLIPVTGAYSNRTTLPFVPGFEGVGTVSRIGSGVKTLKPGDRVLPLGASGLWQAFLLRPVEWCFAIPEDLSNEQAATSYINPMTTLQLLERLREHFGNGFGMDGRKIAITAAGSAIGRMLLKTLTAEGAQITAIVRSAETAESLRAFAGIDIITTGARPPGGDVSLDAVIDAVGGDTGEKLLRHNVMPGGLFLQYGALSGIPIPPSAMAARPDVRFSYLWLRSFVHAADRATLEAALRTCFDGSRSGALRSDIAATYPLSRLGNALAHQKAKDRRGKILIDPRC